MNAKGIVSKHGDCDAESYQRSFDEYYLEPRQLREPPLKLERAVEMLLHACNYARGLRENIAADLLWSKFRELKPRIHNRQPFPKES
jgi:hypothetical protein